MYLTKLYMNPSRINTPIPSTTSFYNLLKLPNASFKFHYKLFFLMFFISLVFLNLLHLSHFLYFCTISYHLYLLITPNNFVTAIYHMTKFYPLCQINFGMVIYRMAKFYPLHQINFGTKIYHIP